MSRPANRAMNSTVSEERSWITNRNGSSAVKVTGFGIIGALTFWKTVAVTAAAFVPVSSVSITALCKTALM